MIAKTGVNELSLGEPAVMVPNNPQTLELKHVEAMCGILIISTY